jgi:hypothetical protein
MMRPFSQAEPEASPQAAIKENELEILLPEPLLEFESDHDNRPTVVFRSRYIGSGDRVPGEQLVNELLQALLDHPDPPRGLLFYSSAIFLALDDSPCLDLLLQLAEKGSEILLCRTSLQTLAPGRQPSAGRVCTLAELVDHMRQARMLLWP